MSPLPAAIILVFAPVALRLSDRVWPHAQRLLLGALVRAP